MFPYACHACTQHTANNTHHIGYVLFESACLGGWDAHVDPHRSVLVHQGDACLVQRGVEVVQASFGVPAPNPVGTPWGHCPPTPCQQCFPSSRDRQGSHAGGNQRSSSCVTSWYRQARGNRFSHRAPRQPSTPFCCRGNQARGRPLSATASRSSMNRRQRCRRSKATMSGAWCLVRRPMGKDAAFADSASIHLQPPLGRQPHPALQERAYIQTVASHSASVQICQHQLNTKRTSTKTRRSSVRMPDNWKPCAQIPRTHAHTQAAPGSTPL